MIADHHGRTRDLRSQRALLETSLELLPSARLRFSVWLDRLMTIVAVLSVLVLVHEIGHFFFARRFAAELPEGFAAIADLCTRERDRLERLWARGPRTLVHGDCHLGNVLWDDRAPLFLDFARGRSRLYPDPPTVEAAVVRGKELLARAIHACATLDVRANAMLLRSLYAESVLTPTCFPSCASVPASAGSSANEKVSVPRFGIADAEASKVLDDTPISNGIRYARNQRVGLSQ